MSERLFPIHSIHRNYLLGVEWQIVEPHEAQAVKNHRQTLEVLASRGGLSLCELAAVLEDRPWREQDVTEALDTVKRAVLNCQRASK
jgi:hypothetical protein